MTWTLCPLLLRVTTIDMASTYTGGQNGPHLLSQPIWATWRSGGHLIPLFAAATILSAAWAFNRYYAVHEIYTAWVLVMEYNFSATQAGTDRREIPIFKTLAMTWLVTGFDMVPHRLKTAQVTNRTVSHSLLS